MISSFQVGPIQFHTYGLVVGLAIAIGFWWAEKKAKNYGILEVEFQQRAIKVIILGLVGARLYHVIDYLDFYSGALDQIGAVWQGGLAIWGGIIGGLVGTWWGGKKTVKGQMRMLDAVALAMPLSQAVGRLGNYINGELYGKVTSLPWGISGNMTAFRYHPLFAYEAGLNLILFWLINFKLTKFDKSGQIFGLYLLGYGLIRFCLEPLRIESWSWGSIPVAMILSLLAILMGIFIIKVRGKVKVVYD